MWGCQEKLKNNLGTGREKRLRFTQEGKRKPREKFSFKSCFSNRKKITETRETQTQARKDVK